MTGTRLPLQDLWDTPAAPGDMPIALLPLHQTATTLIPGLLVSGAAIAGLVTRALGAQLPRRGSTLIVLAVLLVHAGAGAQACVVVARGLEESDAATSYLTALVAAVAIATAMALTTLLLIAKAPVAGAMLGLSAGALAAGIWLNALVLPPGADQSEATMALLGLSRWLPAILIGLAIGWGGAGTIGRVVAVLGGSVILWVGPAAITAVSSATGAHGLLRDPAEMLQYGLEVFRAAVTMPGLAVPPVLLALFVGAIVVLVRAHSRSASATPSHA
ncbi:hypothetical protein [Agrococcus sp. Marseille-P2731]|uniref:hypothetical protein n=1 Tax=Agrococcus sp. Marseille-P2731 TaxID=1841862 RepID=UPI00116086CA|nr:hypothetical protein [Agrococcus sp. Marseille-P2731]